MVIHSVYHLSWGG